MRGNAYKNVPIYDLNPLNGEAVLVELRDFTDFAQKIDWLDGVVLEAAAGHRGPIPELAHGLVEGIKDPWAQLARIHFFVVHFIAFKYEGEEQFEYPRLTVTRRVGDCEDDSVVAAALATALGHVYRFRAFGRTAHDPAHLTTLVAPKGAPNIERVVWAPLDDYPCEVPGWAWCETSFAAHFGEHPYIAAERLGVLDDPGRPEFERA